MPVWICSNMKQPPAAPSSSSEFDVTDQSRVIKFAKFKCKEKDAAGDDETFYIVDLGKVKLQHRVWLHNFPRVKPFYAVKCNNDPEILKTLEQLGVNFDCASINEMKNVLSTGASATRIIYAHPTKPPSHVRFASAVGVDLMTFDNYDELLKVKKIHANPRMVIRISESDPTAGINLDLKFGCSFERAKVLLAQAAEMDIPVVGVSFHVGSLSRDPTAFVSGITHAQELFSIGAQLGHGMHTLDIGGGYPGVCKGGEMEQASRAINAALDQCFPEGCGVQIIAEPGRFYVATSTTLCTQVIGKKQTYERQQNATAYEYTVNDGILTSFNNVLIEHEIPNFVPLKNQSPKPQKHLSKIWGRSAKSMDLLRPSVHLPELAIGDWLVVPNYGAYVMTIQSAFESRSRTEYFYVDSLQDFKQRPKKVLPRIEQLRMSARRPIQGQGHNVKHTKVSELVLS